MSDEGINTPSDTDATRRSKIMLANPSWDTPASAETEGETGPNPIHLLFERMHGRWGWAILLAAILGPALAVLGYLLGPVKYNATAILEVQSRLETLVEETPETREIKVDQEVAEQAELLKDESVFYRALKDEQLEKYTSSRPNFADSIAKNLRVYIPRGSALILVQVEDSDRAFAADAVNAIVNSYLEIFSPNTLLDFTRKVQNIQQRIDAARDRIEDLKTQRIELLRDSQYAITDVQAIITTNVEAIRRLEAQVVDVREQLDLIREFVALEEKSAAESEGREVDEDRLQPTLEARVRPTIEQLAVIDPELANLELELNKIQVSFGLTASRFGEEHQQYRTAKSNVEARQQNLRERISRAEADWFTGPGRGFTWGALQERKSSLEERLEEVRAQNTQLALDMIAAEELEGNIAREEDELVLLVNRRQGLDRERETIKKGRVEVRTAAVPAMTPTNDKKLPAAAGGAALGIGLGFGLFFLLGTIDQKTFGVRQLQNPQNNLRVLGVVPNMDEIEDEATTVTLATDCVHRIRARIEGRRSPEHGYAMMVSSPFQGDGKTTLAVSLGWSYAESGYKTLLLDADFVGRAMTHQFGHLKDPGLREIIRNGEIGDEIHELGHPNLCLLGVGFDRRISAANLSPRLMGRVLDGVRDRFDVILVDSGPLTASIEAIPVASAVDGVVLTLRRGRSRGRLMECIKDVRSVGADYLGLVLNYADRRDCLRHGSTSRMSASVQSALEDDDFSALPDRRNPLLGDLMSSSEERDDSAR